MAKRFVIIGGGPAGNSAATHAARLGAEVTMIERDVIGGAANLWDCIPSKAMIATGSALTYVRQQSESMGVDVAGVGIDIDTLRGRLRSIESELERSVTELLESQRVRLLRGTGRIVGPNRVIADTSEGVVEVEADVIVLATGSRPRIPDWAAIDGDRILSTRDAY